MTFSKKERSDFMDKAEIAMKLQKEAQETAEKTIKQLEEFINDDARIVSFSFIICITWDRLKLFSFNRTPKMLRTQSKF